MRLFYYLPILALPLAACESDTAVQPGIVQWMEWPPEVRANTPFNVQLVIAEPGDCGQQSIYRPRVFADRSAVTFSPYFIVEPPRRGSGPVLPGAYVLEDQADTAGLKGAFVLGYIHQPPGPVCGESGRVFHLVARF